MLMLIKPRQVYLMEAKAVVAETVTQGGKMKRQSCRDKRATKLKILQSENESRRRDPPGLLTASTQKTCFVSLIVYLPVQTILLTDD